MYRNFKIAIVLSACSVATWAQIKEYDFYPEFRRWLVFELPRGVRADRAAVLNLYREKLDREGVPPQEIDRRVGLLEHDRDKLGVDYWNRAFGSGKAVFNTEPNAFLVESVKNRNPGMALDVGMGQGRNAIYLARNGWQVTGIDPAVKGVEIARKTAADLGLKLETVIARDTEYDFGESKWDLILFSWTKTPLDTYDKIVRSLKPGGIVVTEGNAESDEADLLKIVRMSGSLRILKYEIVRAKADYFLRKEMEIVRLLAEKHNL